MTTATPYRTDEPSTTEGWVLLSDATKSHYVRNGRSLCNAWAYFGTRFSASGWVGVEFCAACRKVRVRENLVARYCAEFERTNGHGCQVEYRAGWFVVNDRTLVRLAEFERMVATLESRPTKQEVAP